MTTANFQRVIQEIERRGIIERGIDLDSITRFNRRMARFIALLPPGETPTLTDQPASVDLREWVEAEAEFRAWLYLNKLT